MTDELHTHHVKSRQKYVRRKKILTDPTNNRFLGFKKTAQTYTEKGANKAVARLSKLHPDLPFHASYIIKTYQ